MFLVIFLSAKGLANYEEPTIVSREEIYKKVSIEEVSYDKDQKILSGITKPRAMLTIDIGDSISADDAGAFFFEIPSHVRMVIINAADSEGMYPNSIMFNLEENRALKEGE
ncbi:hypothetical protein [Vagococcus sp.]|uniref:hypothetical protein n=1 Tax=Vagococcus sp. TaxID=1933889 RepID=UPI002FC809D9